MAIKNVVGPGVGFSPASPKYIVTRGFDHGAQALSALKELIAPGLGFSPGSVKFIPTRGLRIGAAAAPSGFTPQREMILRVGRLMGR